MRHLDVVRHDGIYDIGDNSQNKDNATMTYTQYRAALKKLGLTIVGAADPFCLSRRHAQRIAAGDAPIPDLLARVVKLLLAGRLTLADLE